MTTNFGEVLTGADIPGLVDAAKAVSSVGSGVSGSGGGFGDLEGVLRFLERAIPLFEQAGATIMKMQNFEAAEPQQMMTTAPAPPAPTTTARASGSRSEDIPNKSLCSSVRRIGGLRKNGSRIKRFKRIEIGERLQRYEPSHD